MSVFEGFFSLVVDQKVKVLSPFKWQEITILDAILNIYKKISIWIGVEKFWSPHQYRENDRFRSLP